MVNLSRNKRISDGMKTNKQSDKRLFYDKGYYKDTSGPGCLKLTTFLVNVSLKFQMLIYMPIFFVEKS